VLHRIFDDFGSDVFGSPSGVLYQRHLQPSCGLHLEQGILYICRDVGTLVVDKIKTLLTGFHNSRTTHSDLTSTVASHATAVVVTVFNIREDVGLATLR
jgi:hypothetical protein